MRAAVALIGSLLAALAGATPAAALYGAGADGAGAELVSADYERLEQGDDASTYAAVSSDGRFVVIQTRARNFFDDTDADPPGQYRAGGLFRFDLGTQELVKVADGDLFDEASNSFLRRGASNPSVSADGRFVAFTTAESLVAADVNDNADVYVRDMDAAIGTPGAFDLVSARDGGDVPATYAPPPAPSPGSNPGSEVTRGASISGDGRYVVFRTDIGSDLPASGTTSTPARQIFVRDRQLDTTTLITRTDPGGQPAGGAFGSTISADGTTVAWTGSNAPAQTRFLLGEPTESNLTYYMWKRFADGPAAPTRRITGVSDPDDPACPPAQTTTFDASSTGPCYGPLAAQDGVRSSINSQVPTLSADGYTVAFLTGAGPRPAVVKGPVLDLFVTDMRPGVTRKAGTVELTRGSTTTDAATSSPITSISIDPDGEHLALTTARTDFNLPALTQIGAGRTVAGVQELYVVDLSARTLERASFSNAGGDTNGDVQPGTTIAGGGERIAFISSAGNLFFGDANQRNDAFVSTLQETPDTGPPPVEEVPPPPTIEEERLNVRVNSLGKGRVTLEVGVPAAGGLTVLAKGRAGKPRTDRSLAKGTARATEASTVEVPLEVVERYRGELRERGKLKSRARLQFVYALGGRQISDVVGVTFKQKTKRKAGKG